MTSPVTRVVGLPERLVSREPLDGFDRFGKGRRKGDGCPDLAVLVPAEPGRRDETQHYGREPDTWSALFALLRHASFALGPIHHG